MQTMSHALVMGRPPHMTAERATGLIFAGLLQVALIWALIEGLNIKVWPEPTTTTSVRVIRDGTKQPPVIPPVINDWVEPKETTAVQPTVVYDDFGPHNGITLSTGPGQASDFGPAAVAGTHTIPPYPPLAMRLNEAGRVRLHLTITPQGTVSEAAVVRSSGYDDLDQTARNWVMAHWRYRPATHAGVPVPATAEAEVLFDLQNAR